MLGSTWFAVFRLRHHGTNRLVAELRDQPRAPERILRRHIVESRVRILRPPFDRVEKIPFEPADGLRTLPVVDEDPRADVEPERRQRFESRSPLEDVLVARTRSLWRRTPAAHDRSEVEHVVADPLAAG